MPQPESATDLRKRRGAHIYLAASATSQISALLRYVVLARLLGPSQLGMAATLVLTAAFFDFISDTGSDRFLIQDREGDSESVQKLVQLVYVGRGALVATCLLIFAWPVALFYRTPALSGGLAALALSPLILGFLHLDMRRFQRNLDFRADAICQICAEVAGLIATLAAAWLTRRFTAVLYGLIVRAVVLVVVSHLRAERPYRIGFSAEHANRLTRFAAPLLLNGALLYFATQGDRALVGRQLGVAALGRYSAVILLIYYPAAMLTRYLQVMYLPIVAASRDDRVERNRLVETLGGQTVLLGLAMAAGFALVAPLMVTVLYGARFTLAAPVVALIGILQAARFMLIWPTTVALSEGRSGAVLAVNTVRLIAYPAAMVGGWTLGGLGGVVAGFIFGELTAQGTGLAILNRASQAPLFHDFDRIGRFALVSACILGGAWTIERHAILWAAADSVASLIALAWIVRSERTAIGESLALGERVIGGVAKWRRQT